MSGVINASIPLSFRPTPNVGPDIGQAMQDAQRAWQVDAYRRESQQQNALKQILSDPASVDADGNPTPNALRQITAAAPEMGMKLRSNMLIQQQHKLQQDFLKTKTFDQQFQMTNDVSESALIAYEQAIKDGIPEPQARAKAQEVQNQGLERLRQSGMFSEQQQSTFPKAFDPDQARSHSMSYKEWSSAQHQREVEERQAKSEAERERHDRAMEGRESASQAAERDAEAVANAEIERRKAAGETLTPADEAAVRQQARIAPKVSEAAQRQEATAISDDAAKLIAEQTLAGDYHSVTGLGRNVASMRKIADWRGRLAKERGMSGAELASKDAEFVGMTAAQRVLGTRGAGIELGISEAQQFAPMVLDISNRISRTRFPTVNSMELAIEKGTGGEDVVRFIDALNAYKMAYTQILTRGGMPTDDSRRRSDEVIDKAWSSGQIRAAIDQLGKEMSAARSAVPDVRASLWQSLTGRPKDEYPGLRAAPQAKRDIPQAHIDYLKAHPDQAASFDKRYGAGASKRVLGGQ